MSPAPVPQTVLARFQVKQGREVEFEKIHTQSWQAYLRLGMIEEKSHVVLRGQDKDGSTYFVEILTWKDGSITMNPPEEVRALWMQFHDCCERIEFPEVRIVQG